MGQTEQRLSIVIPVYDEVDSLEELTQRVAEELSVLPLDGEIIFVDDGSRDGTGPKLDELMGRYPGLRVFHLRRNFGKAVALTVGFAEARGDLVLTLDGDLQDDPSEIPRMLDKLSGGYDVVSGWKAERQDPWHKVLPSRIFNFITGIFSGLRLRDHNSGLKVYRKEVLHRIDLVGEMHRFITVMAHWQGFRVTEIPVKHHPRRSGRSKYGMSRLAKGFFDFLTLLLTTRYNLRPLHLFGAAGSIFFGLGLLILLYLTVLWFLGLGPIGTRPLLFLGLLLTMVGVQLVSTGLLAELIIRQTLGTRQPVHDGRAYGRIYEPAEVPHPQSPDAADHRQVPGEGS
jgi:glycosyltransferase involved in cell wall biosynthesis